MSAFRIRNDLTPALKKVVAKLQDKKPVLQAIGAVLVSLTKRTITDSSLRPAVWPAKKNGSPATLRKSGDLFQSITITAITAKDVTIGSNKIYAAIHQLGGRAGRGLKSVIPARPYFPVLGGKLTPLAAQKVTEVAKAKVKALAPPTP